MIPPIDASCVAGENGGGRRVLQGGGEGEAADGSGHAEKRYSALMASGTLLSRLRSNRSADLPLAQESRLQIVGSAPLATPAGSFRAWQVQLGGQTAFYEEAAPHRLLRWENDYSVWVLR